MPLYSMNELLKYAEERRYVLGQFTAACLLMIKPVIDAAEVPFIVKIRKTILDDPDLYWPRKVLAPAQEEIKDIVRHELRVFRLLKKQ